MRSYHIISYFDIGVAKCTPCLQGTLSTIIGANCLSANYAMKEWKLHKLVPLFAQFVLQVILLLPHEQANACLVHVHTLKKVHLFISIAKISVLLWGHKLYFALLLRMQLLKATRNVYLVVKKLCKMKISLVQLLQAHASYVHQDFTTTILQHALHVPLICTNHMMALKVAKMVLFVSEWH